MTARYFHCSSSLLSPDSIVEPGNWGRIIKNVGWLHPSALKEVALEHIRAQEFPAKPSRLLSIFLLDDANEAKFYAVSDGRQTTMLAYEVELLNPAVPTHSGDWRHVAPEGELSLDWVRAYWRGEHFPRHVAGEWNVACRETICESAVKVIQRL
jgi:hypothetical protein